MTRKDLIGIIGCIALLLGSGYFAFRQRNGDVEAEI